jgi:hypothetical protein
MLCCIVTELSHVGSQFQIPRSDTGCDPDYSTARLCVAELVSRLGDTELKGLTKIDYSMSKPRIVFGLFRLCQFPRPSFVTSEKRNSPVNRDSRFFRQGVSEVLKNTIGLRAVFASSNEMTDSVIQSKITDQKTLRFLFLRL